MSFLDTYSSGSALASHTSDSGNVYVRKSAGSSMAIAGGLAYSTFDSSNISSYLTDYVTPAACLVRLKLVIASPLSGTHVVSAMVRCDDTTPAEVPRRAYYFRFVYSSGSGKFNLQKLYPDSATETQIGADIPHTLGVGTHILDLIDDGATNPTFTVKHDAATVGSLGDSTNPLPAAGLLGLVHYNPGGTSTSGISIDAMWAGPSTGPTLACPVGSTSLTVGGPTTTATASGFSGGQVYSSSNTAVATVDPSTGVVTPVGAGTCTITATGSVFSLETATSSTITVTSSGATAFTLTGPSSGYAANASANFTVQPNGVTSATFTPTPASGVTFSPATLTWTGDAAAKTFTALKATPGTVSVNGAMGSLTPPSSLSYTFAARTLSASPGTIAASATSTVTLTGGGTKWQTTAPTFGSPGLAGASFGSVTVLSDTSATVPVTAGTTTGTVTFTDSGTGATATAAVSSTTAAFDIADFTAAYTGLVGSIGVALYDAADSVVSAWSTDGVAEGNPGAYKKSFDGLVAGASYYTRWSVGPGSPPFASNPLDVASAPTIDQIKAMIEQTVVGGLLVDGQLVTRGYTAQAIGATSITLAAGDPQFVVSNVGQTIRLLSGTGKGQTGIVTASNTSTGQQTIGAHWSDGVTPSGSVAYQFEPVASGGSGGSGTDGLAASGAVEPGETGYQTLRLIRAFALGEMDLTSVSGHAIFRRKDGTEAFRIALPSNAGRPGGVNGGGL